MQHTFDGLKHNFDAREWAKQSDGENGFEVGINTAFEFQAFKGVGGCFNELGWRALQSAGAADRAAFLSEIFSPERANFNFCRMPIGSNDFSFGYYSYDDVDGDYALKNFSTGIDERALAPYIKEAQKYNPDLTVHASPWCPPAWMKDNGQYAWGGSLRDEERVYKAYAEYFARFVEEYAARGVTVERVMPQNEPDCANNYPTNKMPPAQMAKFIVGYLAPAFKARGLKTEIWGGSFRNVNGSWSLALAARRGVADAIRGFGYQYTVPYTVYDTKRLFPNLGAMHTESPCYNGEDAPEQAGALFLNLIDYFNAGVENYSYWNIALPEDKKSTWGWAQNSLAVVKGGRVERQPDFYILQMLGKGIERGARRVHSVSVTRKVCAFKKGDTVSLMVPNFKGADSLMKVYVDDGGPIEITLKPDTANIVKLREKGGKWTEM
jgi:glucosylceramidase